MTAQDFVYSWRRLVDPANSSPFAWFARLAGIVNAEQIIAGTQTPDQLGVRAVDAHTLRVQLNKPVPYFINLVGHFSLFPVHQKTVEQFGNGWTKPGNLMGNSAFALKERVVNEKLVLTPNPYYWDRANTRLTKVTFVPINQESNATKRYLAEGGISISPNLSPSRCTRSCSRMCRDRCTRHSSWEPTTTRSTPSVPRPMMHAYAGRSPMR